ncbi:MAG: hypothetical protein J0L89_00620 [Xanthomonadales bacterium]|nr:hypothetical protein [Xanthomonadales bacterium]
MKKSLGTNEEFGGRTCLDQHVCAELAKAEHGRCGVVKVMDLRRHPPLLGDGYGNALGEFI